MRRYLVTCDDCPTWQETHDTEPAARRAGKLHAARTHAAELRDSDIDEFVRAHVGLAAYFAHRAGLLPGETFDDVHADALIGLWDAARRWRPDLGLFVTYAAARIKGEIGDARRDRDPLSRSLRRQGALMPVSLDAPLSTDDPRTLADTVTDAVDPIADWLDEQEARDRHERLHVALEQLPPRVAHVLRGQIDGRTLATLGAELGVTESRAHQMRVEGIGRLRRLMVAA